MTARARCTTSERGRAVITRLAIVAVIAALVGGAARAEARPSTPGTSDARGVSCAKPKKKTAAERKAEAAKKLEAAKKAAAAKKAGAKPDGGEDAEGAGASDAAAKAGDATAGKSAADGAKGEGAKGAAKSAGDGASGAADGARGAADDAGGAGNLSGGTVSGGTVSGGTGSRGAADRSGVVRAADLKASALPAGRKGSQVTPGAASRWSNRGAMTPIESEVPLTAELPERAKPLAPGQETPGQALTGVEELLQFRFVVSGYHAETLGQDYVYNDPEIPNVPVTDAQQVGQDRFIDLMRFRASMAYERIGGTELGAHLDVEYRPRAGGSRPTDYRLNELYLSWGLTDFRGRTGGPDFGAALGRLAIREAGYARADGLALRYRVLPDLNVGAFGGFTGNPYGYNWALHKTEELSTEWMTGGAFVSYRGDRVFGSVAGVATLAGLGRYADVRGSTEPGKNGLDRLYVYVDAAWLASEDLDVFALGFVDVVGGLPIQSAELVGAYKLTDRVDLRVGVGRFSTILYDATTAYAYAIHDAKNQGLVPGSVVVDENDRPIVPHDAVLQTAIYNHADLRAGYRFTRALEAWLSTELVLREPQKTQQEQQAVTGGQIEFAPLRLLPGVGARFRDPDLLDAGVELTYLVDEQSNASAIVQGSLGRAFGDLRVGVDGRAFFGDVAGKDGGAELTYTLPRDWMPGRLALRVMARYFEEDIAIARPKDPSVDIIADAAELVLIPKQQSWTGFASLEWRY
ncbi:hypothetical protein L6R52_03445 [Myxococcota bacterium]|nr:hypothetical protein [Myxococcota bacterium]